jgi:hypothetical protein
MRARWKVAGHGQRRRRKRRWRRRQLRRRRDARVQDDWRQRRALEVRPGRGATSLLSHLATLMLRS